MKIARVRSYESLLVFLAATATLSTAYPASADDQNSTQNDGTLATVIVTAQRRAEREQDVPISITTIGASQLKQAGATSLTNIQALTPGLRFDDAGAFVQPSIRGVGSAVVTAGAGSNVGVYVDGFYIMNQQTMDMDFLNVKNIQVLEGPQGTLFGYNSTGGDILVTTAKPSTHTNGTVDVSYGDYNTQRYEGYFTTGITQDLAFDFAGLVSKGDGYLHDIVTGSDTDGAYDNWMIRTGFEWDPTNRFSVLFRYLHESTNDPANQSVDAYVQHGTVAVPGGGTLPNGQILVPAYYAFPGSRVATGANQVAYDTGASQPGFTDSSNGFYLTESYDMDFASLTSYTQYRRDTAHTYNQDYGGAAVPGTFCLGGVPWCHTFDLNIPVTDRTITQEFLLKSEGNDRLKWTAGLFYLDFKEDFIAAGTFNGSMPPLQVANNGTDTGSVAAYADATYRLAHDFYLTGGVRFSHDEVRQAFYQAALPVSPAVTTLPTLSSNHASPRAVLRYTPTDDSSVYFSFSRGFKAAIYNVGGDQATPVKPESIDAYEVGYKYAGRAILLSTAAYYYDYTNLQVANYEETESLVTNAASSHIHGLEGQLQYQVTPAFNVRIGIDYNDAVYDHFVGAPTYYWDAAANSVVQSSSTLNDAPMMRAPKYTGNIGGRYTVPLAGGALSLSENLYYTSKFYFDAAHEFYQSGYPLLSLRAAWTDASGRYTLAVYGDNVTGSHYRSLVLNTATSIENGWGAPATYGVEVSAHLR